MKDRTSTESYRLAKTLTDAVMSIKLNELVVNTGINSKQAALTAMRFRTAGLVRSIAEGEPSVKVRDKFEDMVRSIEAGQILGSISSNELQKYQAVIDDLWAAIRKEYS